ncbi:helix-turn-helix transcriptional regulator [Nocardioides sp. KR10-350]|uniref:helix-turn-helix domain-containing protein n=1 Tax=Nocardioides cheoyonin TaxID=3156615 RepID=UPI0032B5FEC4
MPRRYAARPIAERGETNLARRVERERKARGWSYETLAKEMTDVGCTISKAALYSIENGKPPRRITVDELTGFAEIFTDGDVAEMLKPPELVDQDRAHELVTNLLRCIDAFGHLASETFTALLAFYDLVYENSELAEYVGHQLDSRAPAQYEVDLKAGPEGEVVTELALLRLVMADHEHLQEMRTAARMAAAYRNGNWSAEDDRLAETELGRLRAKIEKARLELEED